MFSTIGFKMRRNWLCIRLILKWQNIKSRITSEGRMLYTIYKQIANFTNFDVNKP